MDRTEELRLVAALRKGDEAAFVVVYDACRARLFSFIFRMVRRRSIAEELAQEVWMRLAARARALREDTRLEAWLFTVARNLCLSYWRTTSIDPTVSGGTPIDDQAAAAGLAPDDQAALGQLHARLEAALAALMPPYREVLLLVGVHGMTPAEASVVCGVTPAAMRKRLQRAREMLEELMGTMARRV